MITRGNAVSHLLIAASVLAAAAAYYSYNIAFFIAAATLAFVIYRYSAGHAGEADGPQVIRFLLITAAVFAAARMYAVFSYPPDFVADEWNQILDSYYVITGNKGLFDYGKRFGSSFVFLSEAVIAAVLFFCRENIDVLRLIPVSVFFAAAAGMYMLGKLLAGRQGGAVFVFIYCTSGWALFLSKQLMENIYVPLFTVWFLYFFLSFLKNMKPGSLAACGLVLFGGMFTYSSWVLMLIFAVYLVFEYRKELGGKYSAAALLFIAGCAVTYAALSAKYGNAFSWIRTYTLLDTQGGALKMAGNLKSIFTYFTRPLSTTMSFVSTEPLFGFSEFAFLAGGAVFALAGIKQKEKRVFLAGFLLALVTLVISKNPDHNLRHVLILPFAAVLSALFAVALIRWRYFYVIAAVHCLMTVNIFFYHYAEWGLQLNISGVRREAASYINTAAGNNGYYFPDLISASSQPVLLRVKNAYRQVPAAGADKIILAVNSYWRKGVLGLFPGAKVKYFHSRNQGPNTPLCVFEIEGAGHAGMFDEISATVNKYNVKYWMLDSESMIKYGVSGKGSGPADILRQSISAAYFFAALGMQNREDEKFVFISGLPEKIILNAEAAYYLGVKYTETGDYTRAVYWFSKAADLAPEWQAPAIWLEQYIKRGLM